MIVLLYIQKSGITIHVTMNIPLYVKSRGQQKTCTWGYTSQIFLKLVLRTLSMCPLSTTFFEFEVMKGFEDLLR